VWTLPEIWIAQKTVYPSKSLPHVLKTFSYIGGIPRQIFDVPPDDPIKYLRAGLLKGFNNIEAYVESVGQLCYADKANHHLLHMFTHPTDNTYKDGLVLFASPYAAQLVAKTLERKKMIEIIRIVQCKYLFSDIHPCPLVSPISCFVVVSCVFIVFVCLSELFVGTV